MEAMLQSLKQSLLLEYFMTPNMFLFNHTVRPAVTRRDAPQDICNETDFLCVPPSYQILKISTPDPGLFTQRPVSRVRGLSSGFSFLSLFYPLFSLLFLCLLSLHSFHLIFLFFNLISSFPLLSPFLYKPFLSPFLHFSFFLILM